MKKDAFYFPHFSNARNDSKLIKLRRVLGLEGYAIYFMLLETLREQTNFKYHLSGVEDLAFEWHTSREKIMSVISGFELFTIDETDFFSHKLVLYLQPYLEKSARASLAANKRWESVKNQLNEANDINAKAYTNADAKALQMQSSSNASKVKESKEKEIKVNESKESFDFKKSLILLNIDENIVENWLKIRKSKKAVNTEIAFNSIKKEIEKSGMLANDCILKAVEKSWAGFEAEWIKNSFSQKTNSNIYLTKKNDSDF